MNIIPGIEKLISLTPVQIEKLNKGAQRHLNLSNISFTVLSWQPDRIEIEVAQGETSSGKYASDATLISRTKELFGKLLPAEILHINPVTYTPSPASIVTTAWLEAKMQQKGVRIKQLAFDTGIDRESISSWVTGKRSMSQLVKAMFYFYFSRS